MVHCRKSLIEAIEAGQQRGLSRSEALADSELWWSAALQKHDGQYKAHVSCIKAENSAQAQYEILFTRAFMTLEEACNCIESNSPLRPADFIALKGQRIFDPSFNEENDH